MPFGTASYNTAAQKLTSSYKPAGTLPAASYQLIQWSNFTETFSSAIASKTGPAVSSGGAFQAFQFSDQGAIAYADNLIASWKKDGTFDDFLPGTIDALKTDKGYVAVPELLDMRPFWYRKSLLDANGITPPATWDEYMMAATKLANKGLYAFGIGAGTGNNLGAHAMVSMMINNGGGIFNPDNRVDLVTDRNIETITFINELYHVGAIDHGAVAYTTDNLTAQWKSKKVAMGIHTSGLNDLLGEADDDVLVASPMTALHGDKGTLQFLGNLMMYKNNPSQQGTEAFVTYFVKNMNTLWQQRVIPSLPVLKSIVATPQFQANKQKAKVIAEWQPVAKSYAATGTKITSAEAPIDAGQALNTFTQRVLSGGADPKKALTQLQDDISALVK
jgi:multiple sugar transport system substrate-binding protein